MIMSLLTVFELLNLRYEFEELTQGYKLSGSQATLDTIEDFVENGHKSNRFRPNFDRAMEVAKEILKNA